MALPARAEEETRACPQSQVPLSWPNQAVRRGKQIFVFSFTHTVFQNKQWNFSKSLREITILQNCPCISLSETSQEDQTEIHQETSQLPGKQWVLAQGPVGTICTSPGAFRGGNGSD